MKKQNILKIFNKEFDKLYNIKNNNIKNIKQKIIKILEKINYNNIQANQETKEENTNEIEIERKFLVDKSKLPEKYDKKYLIKQGYLINNKNFVVRIRQKNNNYILTIKIRTNNNMKRIEKEENITKKEFDILWEKINKKIEKTRKIILNKDGTKWEIDFFKNLKEPHEKLILAEIELKKTNQKFKIPKWITREVTNNPEYYNNNLIKFVSIEKQNKGLILK